MRERVLRERVVNEYIVRECDDKNEHWSRLGPAHVIFIMNMIFENRRAVYELAHFVFKVY